MFSLAKALYGADVRLIYLLFDLSDNKKGSVF